MPKMRKKTQEELDEEKEAKGEEIWDDNPLFDDDADDSFDERN